MPGRNLPQPFLQIVVIADARDPPLPQLEKRAHWQQVRLPCRRRQALIRGKISSVNHEFRSRPLVIGADHHHQVFHALGITALHSRKECAEGSTPDLARALVDVMRHILGKASQHSRPIAGVEGGVIRLNQTRAHARSSAGMRAPITARIAAAAPAWQGSITGKPLASIATPTCPAMPAQPRMMTSAP